MIKLKDLLNERYISKQSDTIEDVFKSAAEALEDLSDLFRKNFKIYGQEVQHLVEHGPVLKEEV